MLTIEQGTFISARNWKWNRCQLYLTLCDPMDCSLPGSIHGIFQARVLDWVAIFFSRGSSQPGDGTQVSFIIGRKLLPSEPPGKSQFILKLL